ncbi:MAG: peptide ABC transporter ATP-binding protein [Halobacteriales archaeon]
MSNSTGTTAGLAPLSVETDLTLTVNGAEATVESTGERLLVSFGSLPDGIRALRGQRESAAGPISTLLETTDLTVEIRIRGRTVAVAGADARPGVLSRQLGVAPLEARLGGAVSAVGAEISAGVRAINRFFQ